MCMKLSLKNLNYLNQKKKDLNYSLSSLLQSRIRLTHFSIVHLLINYMHNVNPSLSISKCLIFLPHTKSAIAQKRWRVMNDDGRVENGAWQWWFDQFGFWLGLIGVCCIRFLVFGE